MGLQVCVMVGVLCNSLPGGPVCVECFCFFFVVEYSRGVSLLHLYGEAARCSSLPTLLQTLLLQLYTGEHTHTLSL